MASPLQLIIEREYLERVKRKSFIITTILVPVLMLGLMMAPVLIMMLSKPEKKEVMVVDHTGVLANRLEGNDEITFISSTASADSLRANEDVEAILVIGKDAVSDPSKGIALMTRNSVSMMTDSYISSQIATAIEDVRLERYDVANIREILDSVTAEVQMATVRIDSDNEQTTSSEVSYFMALTLDMMLYMFILIYGQQVMTSIIEEKNNRVLEIVVSSVKPFQLMLGKIVGIGLVALTQILIWGVLIGIASGIVLPILGNQIPADSIETSAAIAQLSDVGFLASIFIFILLFFAGGFLFYSSMFAAIGSSVSNIQDASQLSSIATMPIIIGILGSMAALNDPNSWFSFWVSIIPLTSPMGMMTRLPFGVPLWQTLLSLALLYGSFLLMMWLCGKIYRVGIFMYGKKPTLKEIIKWAKAK